MLTLHRDPHVTYFDNLVPRASSLLRSPGNEVDILMNFKNFITEDSLLTYLMNILL